MSVLLVKLQQPSYLVICFPTQFHLEWVTVLGQFSAKDSA